MRQCGAAVRSACDTVTPLRSVSMLQTCCSSFTQHWRSAALSVQKRIQTDEHDTQTEKCMHISITHTPTHTQARTHRHGLQARIGPTCKSSLTHTDTGTRTHSRARTAHAHACSRPLCHRCSPASTPTPFASSASRRHQPLFALPLLPLRLKDWRHFLFKEKKLV